MVALSYYSGLSRNTIFGLLLPFAFHRPQPNILVMRLFEITALSSFRHVVAILSIVTSSTDGPAVGFDTGLRVAAAIRRNEEMDHVDDTVWHDDDKDWDCIHECRDGPDGLPGCECLEYA